MTKLNPHLPILLVDDEEEILEIEELTLKVHKLNNIITCTKASAVLELIEKRKPLLALLDINMPEINGIELLEKITENHPETSVIMLTGNNDLKVAVQCIKKGAFDYIVKPLHKEELISSVQKALAQKILLDENFRMKESFLSNEDLEKPQAFEHIISRDIRILNTFKYIEAIAPFKLPVLITGETGSGKELFAKAIHNASGFTGEFVAINCAGIDDQFFSDTLFGHTKDAFTGALKKREGLITKAKSGTLFLDEIGDLKNESQVKLLRLLQDGTYYPLGSDMLKKSETRIITATNVNLLEACEKGFFRKDLYYRLQTHEIQIPALRERKNDIKLLTDFFIEKTSLSIGKTPPHPPSELYILLKNYDYPGNVRELESIISKAVSLHKKGILSLEHFKKSIKSKASTKLSISPTDIKQEKVSFPGSLPTLKEIEEALVEEALKRTNGNKSLAANLIGTTRKTLKKKFNN